MSLIDNILTELERIRDERGTHANTATRVGTALIDLLSLISGIGNSKLSKTDDDTASGEIGFQKGLWVKTANGASKVIELLTSGLAKVKSLLVNGTWGIDDDGDATLHDVAANDVTARDAAIRDVTGRDAEFENLRVTKEAHFFRLVVDELLSNKGAIIISSANCVAEIVVADPDHETPYYYDVYFPTTDRDGNSVSNPWVAGDQAVCLTFKGEGSGTFSDVKNRYYWRFVNLASSNVTYNGGTYHLVRLSNVSGDFDGSTIPAAGDNIVQLGYQDTDNDARQTAIIISSYPTMDTGVTPPSLAFYKGINEFSLSSHRYTYMDGVANEFFGDFKVLVNNSYTSMTTLLATTNSLIAAISDGLGTVGININGDDKEIKLLANKVNFYDSTGTNLNPKIWIDPTRGNIHAVDGDFEGTVKASNLYHSICYYVQLDSNGGGAYYSNILYRYDAGLIDESQRTQPPYSNFTDGNEYTSYQIYDLSGGELTEASDGFVSSVGNNVLYYYNINLVDQEERYKYSMFQNGGYYTSEQIYNESNGVLNSGDDGFIPTTGKADVVMCMPKTSNWNENDRVTLPMPEDFQGKIVEISAFHYGSGSSNLYIQCVSTLIYGDNINNRKIAPYLYINSSGNITVLQPQPYAVIATGGVARFLSAQLTNGKWVWVLLANQTGGDVYVIGDGGGIGGGTVTEVGMSVPTGFSVSPETITTNGTFAITFASGYALPTTAKQSNWDTAYGWGDHSQVGYLTSVSFSDLPTLYWANVAISNQSNNNTSPQFGELRLRPGSNNYGSYLYFGDYNYCYLQEDSDNHLKIYGSHGVEITTDSGYDLTWGGYTLATQVWVGQQGYITSSAISDMATKTWVDSQSFVTESAFSGMLEDEAYISNGTIYIGGNSITPLTQHQSLSGCAQIGAHNNLTASGNEFTCAASGQSGTYYINYRTAGGSNGSITEYRFCDGAGNTLASISNGQFSGNAASATKALKVVQGNNDRLVSNANGVTVVGGNNNSTIGFRTDGSAHYEPYIMTRKTLDGSNSAEFHLDYYTANGGHHFKDATSSYADVYAKSFVANGSSNDYVLLGGGGTKAVTDFATWMDRPLTARGLNVAGDSTLAAPHVRVTYDYVSAGRFSMNFKGYAGDSLVAPISYIFDAPITQGSDMRRKEVTDYLEPSVYDMASVPLVRFRWKNDAAGTEHVGTVAQYWQRVVPELVGETQEGWLTMDYQTAGVVVGVTAARKAVELERRIEEQERRIEELERIINQLKGN